MTLALYEIALCEREEQKARSRKPYHKLTWPDVLRMRRMRKEGATLGELAKEFGCTRQNVWCVVEEITWRPT